MFKLSLISCLNLPSASHVPWFRTSWPLRLLLKIQCRSQSPFVLHLILQMSSNSTSPCQRYWLSHFLLKPQYSHLPSTPSKPTVCFCTACHCLVDNSYSCSGIPRGGICFYSPCLLLALILKPAFVRFYSPYSSTFSQTQSTLQLLLSPVPLSQHTVPALPPLTQAL